MVNFLVYLLESSVILCIFLMIYKYIYHKLAYFQWNRFYLTGTAILSLILPVIPVIFEVNNIIPIKTDNIIELIDYKTALTVNKVNFKEENTGDFINILIYVLSIIWLSGFVFQTLKLISAFLKIRKIKNNSEAENFNNYKIFTTNEGETAFSLFKHIFVNKDFRKLTAGEQNKILEHEKIHLNQLHSADNLFFQLIKIVHWFNPFIKNIINNVSENHEFIVDTILTKNTNKPEYSRLIVKLASSEKSRRTASYFSKHEIRNRIILISNPETEALRKRRFKTSLPILIFIVTAIYYIFSILNMSLGVEYFKTNMYAKPFPEGTYKLISPFFENIQLNDTTKILHPEASFAVKSFTVVYAPAESIITKIDTINYYGIQRINITFKISDKIYIEYKNLYKVHQKINSKVNRNQIVATTGDVRLYPNVNIKLIKNKTSIAPSFCY